MSPYPLDVFKTLEMRISSGSTRDNHVHICFARINALTNRLVVKHLTCVFLATRSTDLNSCSAQVSSIEPDFRFTVLLLRDPFLGVTFSSCPVFVALFKDALKWNRSMIRIQCAFQLYDSTPRCTIYDEQLGINQVIPTVLGIPCQLSGKYPDSLLSHQ